MRAARQSSHDASTNRRHTMTAMTTNHPATTLTSISQSCAEIIATASRRLAKAFHIPAILPSKHWIA